MIPTLLKDAAAKIERIQAEHPEIYAGFQKEIDCVKADMLALAERVPRYWEKGTARRMP